MKLQELLDSIESEALDVVDTANLYVRVGRQLREVEAAEIDADGDVVFTLGGVIG